MSFERDGKQAAVAGGDSGLGLTGAKGFIAAGASVTILSERETVDETGRDSALAPGPTMTGMAGAVGLDEAALAPIPARSPLGRFADPSEQASVAAFLLSAERASSPRDGPCRWREAGTAIYDATTLILLEWCADT